MYKIARSGNYSLKIALLFSWGALVFGGVAISDDPRTSETSIWMNESNIETVASKKVPGRKLVKHVLFQWGSLDAISARMLANFPEAEVLVLGDHPDKVAVKENVIPEFVKLQSLETLAIHGAIECEDQISSLQSMCSLKRLCLTGGAITDANVLSKIRFGSTLEELKIECDFGIDTFDWLSDLKDLRTLEISAQTLNYGALGKTLNRLSCNKVILTTARPFEMPREVSKKF